MLHITGLQVTSSTTLEITFTSNLTNQLEVDNVSLVSSDAQSVTVLDISIQNNTLILTTHPLTPTTSYTLYAVSGTLPFVSINGDRLIEDGINNAFSFVAPIQIDNLIKNSLLNYFRGNIYQADDNTSLISKYVDGISLAFSKALYDVRQLKNENYLSVPVMDEIITRGDGPFDHLPQEACYEVLRVAKTKTGSKSPSKIVYSEFPASIVTLQQAQFSETLTPSSSNAPGTFQINDLILNLTKFPVTKITSLIFNFATINPVFVYDLTSYGYQQLNSSYDQENSSNYLLLKNNQAKVSQEVLKTPLFSLKDLINVVVEYQYKDLGIFVDENSVSVTSTLFSSRKVLPPLLKVVQLDHYPIVTSSGATPTANGLTINVPNSSAKHPAFLTELPFRLNGLPIAPGQYSVDYNFGKIYVFGATKQDGTGDSPPVVSYYYKQGYSIDVDYSYDADTLDLVSLPDGAIRGFPGTISFMFEKVLVPNVDYVAKVHEEVIGERINNKLTATNSLKVSNYPVTNVFRIYNETSGEIYPVTRWNNDKVYFRFNNSPTVSQTTERVSFKTIVNELLVIHSESINLDSIKVAEIRLSNQNIGSSREDFLADSFSSSLLLSSPLFQKEKWFDKSLSTNKDHLAVGQYTVDYANGIVYLGVLTNHTSDFGTASYKISEIIPSSPHIIAVDELYYTIDSSIDKTSHDYISFADNSIIPAQLHSSVQLYYGDSTTIYQVNGTSIGSFIDLSFVSTLSKPIRAVRGIYEYSDLLHNVTPLNFPSISTSTTVNTTSVNDQFSTTISYDGLYYINLPLPLFYKSSNITYSISIVRQDDAAELWDNAGVFVFGDSLRLTLSGVNAPIIGDQVVVTYSFQMNNLARAVLDLDYGDLCAAYTYLADEIVVDYEFGENQIDFRKSNAIKPGDEYFVNYKVGSLRDTLFSNFGSLLNVSDLTNFTTDLNRERYRDAVRAGLSSFVTGPTIPSLKNIGKMISHIEPELTESQFNGWSLGSSLLQPQAPETTGNFELLPAKFGLGPHITSQSISLPTESNLNPQAGTFETWVIPDWNGLSSLSSLEITITRNALAMDNLSIFIGEKEIHPSSNSFVVDEQLASGAPVFTKDGVFIYYTDRWNMRVIDGYTNPGLASYVITIKSSGEIYDLLKESAFTTTSQSSKLVAKVLDSHIDSALSFVSDEKHYIIDVGDKKANRLSIYKDSQGYLNFSVLDKLGKQYSISSNISNWVSGDKHHVAASWNLKSSEDEMHLFIDGKEVENQSRYKSTKINNHQKFRSIEPSRFIYSGSNDIVGSNDLIITSGSAIVTSTINFSSHAIFPGDTLFINELGFNPVGYSIASVSGQSLILSAPLGLSMTNASFSVNKTEIVVSQSVELNARNILTVYPSTLTGTVSTTAGLADVSSVTFDSSIVVGDLIKISGVLYTVEAIALPNLTLSDLQPTTGSFTFHIYGEVKSELHSPLAVRPDYSISAFGYGSKITLLNGVNVNDLVFIGSAGMTFETIKNDYFIWGTKENKLAFSKPPTDISKVKIKKILLPNTLVGPLNSVYTTVFTSINLVKDQPSLCNIGRHLQASIYGTNIDFTTPPTVSLVGTNSSGPVSETISVLAPGAANSVNVYQTITSIIVTMKPANSAKAAGTVSVMETFNVNESDGNTLFGKVRYSYSLGAGYLLASAGTDLVTNTRFNVSQREVGATIQIASPLPVAGYYTITEAINPTTLRISPNLPAAFTNGIYKIYRTDDSSGVQNGFITFEENLKPGTPYYLSSGHYSVEYPSTLSIDVELQKSIWIGSDQEQVHYLDGVLDQTQIFSQKLLDSRVGEIVTNDSITRHANLAKPSSASTSTLVLLDYNTFPFVNKANTYKSDNVGYLPASSVGALFGDSAQFTSPIILDNLGIINSTKDGTIEFWVSPNVDTHDNRKYSILRADSAITAKLKSSTSTMIELPSNASKILSVKAQGKDYVAGSTLEYSSYQATVELLLPNDVISVTVSKSVLQVLSVRIDGDLSNREYVDSSIVGLDGKTIYLTRPLPSTSVNIVVSYKANDGIINSQNTRFVHLKDSLPYEQTDVEVTYLPAGISGNSISIEKDELGYIVFMINANQENVIRAPVYWKANTWHRVKATYKMNQGLLVDEMRLFIDGYCYTNNIAGIGLPGVFPESVGTGIPGDGYHVQRNILYTDPIHSVRIGEGFHGRLDNLRISSIARPLTYLFSEPFDLDYSLTPEPVVEDLYTTYLFDAESSRTKVNDFATIYNKDNGSFDFSMTILDSLGIIGESPRVRQVLEKLLAVLKPANSKLLLNYKK
jgi:hypothetical protein